MTKYYAPEFKVTVNGSELTADISRNVETIQVVRDIDSSKDKCTLTIVNAAPKMRWTHDPVDALLFWMSGEIRVAMGYVDDLEEVMVGSITGLSATFDSGIPKIKVTATNPIQKVNGDKKTRTYTGMTVKAIVEEIGQKNGLQVQADDPGVTYPYKIQPNQTDFRFLRDMAVFFHYELMVVDKTLYFRKPKPTDDKLYTFVWSPTGVYSSTENTLPLKSFVPKADSLTPYTQTETRCYDAKTKAAIVGKGTSGELDKTGGSESGSDNRQNAQGSHQQTVVTHFFRSQAEADAHAKAALASSVKDFVEGNAQTIGVPDLKPGAAVNLDGLGFLFNGQYNVQSVTHTIGTGGYTTDFAVHRNAANAK